MENLNIVSYGAPIKKYGETTPSVDGVSSFLQKKPSATKSCRCLSKNTPTPGAGLVVVKKKKFWQPKPKNNSVRQI
jgi:hypothetical protein